MIDLHVHTNYSDGTDSVIEVLKKAESKKIKYLAITDHNNCDAYEELEKINIKDYYSGNIISGIELNTKVFGIPIEILGYGVDPKKMNKITKTRYMTNRQRNILEMERLYEKCKKEGFAVENDILEKYDPSIYPSRYLHRIITQDEANKKIVDEDAWENSNIFYRKYMSNPESIFYVDTNDILPSFDEAAQFIRDAGGLVFIPHIHEYRDNSDKILDEILNNHKVDGIECYYTTFKQEQIDRLLNICKENNLFISGGSDYHGMLKPNVDMCTGEGNLNIPEDIVMDWKTKVIWFN